MKTKAFVWGLIISSIVCIVGIVLICNYAGLYTTYSSWLSNYSLSTADYYDMQFYWSAVNNIDEARAGFYSGIGLTVVGGLSAIFLVVRKNITCESTTAMDNSVSNLD